MKRFTIMKIFFFFFVLTYYVSANKLKAPKLISPKDSIETKGVIFFKWEEIDDSASYFFEMAYDSNFTDIIITLTQFNSNLYFRLYLSPCDSFFWRVRAVDIFDSAGDWSEIRYVHKLKPRKPILLEPANFSENISKTTVFKFTIKYSQDKDFLSKYDYYIELDTNSKFNTKNKIIQHISHFDSTCTVEDLLSDKQYFWRIFCDVCDDTLYSETFQFHSVKWETPKQTSLISPEDNSKNVPNKNTKFVWELGHNVKECLLTLGEDSLFFGMVQWDIKNIPDSLKTYEFTIDSVLKLGTKYYWKVYSYVGNLLQETPTYVFYTSSTSGLNSKQKALFLLAPNPARDYIELSIPPSNKRGSEAVLVKIYDVLGVKQHVSFAATPLSEGNLRLDVSSLPAGVYFVRVGGQVLKFVKL